MSGPQSKRSNQDGASTRAFSVGTGTSQYKFTLTRSFKQIAESAASTIVQESGIAGETEQSSGTISQGTIDAIKKLVQERRSRKGDPEDGANSTFAPSTSVPKKPPTAASVIKSVSCKGGDTPEGVATADAATDATGIYSKISNHSGELISRMPKHTEPESEPPRTELPRTEPPTEPPRMEPPRTEPPTNRSQHKDANSFMMQFLTKNSGSVKSLRKLEFGGNGGRSSMACFYRE